MSATATPAVPVAPPATTPPPQGTGPRPWKWSREDYYKLGELGFFNGKRVELIFGEIVEMSPIGWPHVVGCRRTAELLERVFAGVAWVSRSDPINLTDSEPQPDVAVHAGRMEDYADHPTSALLIVEVADTTLLNDTTRKVELYATAGIADYWVLDVVNRQLHVYRDPQSVPAGLGAASYRTHQVLGLSESIAPLAASHAIIRVSDLLPPTS